MQSSRVCHRRRRTRSALTFASNPVASFSVLGGTTATMRCPAAGDGVEIGGELTIYIAPMYEADGADPVTCTIAAP